MSEKINSAQLNRQKLLLQKQQQKMLKEYNSKAFAEYKKKVINTFLAVFSSNYGDGVDFTSLINSIIFSTSTDSQGIEHFSFDCKMSNIDFESFIKNQEKQKFNNNNYKDFFASEEIINNEVLQNFYFSSQQEYNNIENSDSGEMNFLSQNQVLSFEQEYNGVFIPISKNGERYGMDNLLNQSKGYSSVSDSIEECVNLISQS